MIKHCSPLQINSYCFGSRGSRVRIPPLRNLTPQISITYDAAKRRKTDARRANLSVFGPFFRIYSENVRKFLRTPEARQERVEPHDKRRLGGAPILCGGPRPRVVGGRARLCEPESREAVKSHSDSGEWGIVSARAARPAAPILTLVRNWRVSPGNPGNSHFGENAPHILDIQKILHGGGGE